jgi:hypothetical protein
MYAGGQLVRNTVDGSRPGYNGLGGNQEKAQKEFYDTYGKATIDKASKQKHGVTFNKLKDKDKRSNFKRKFKKEFEKSGTFMTEGESRKFFRQKRVLREQDIQIKLLDATNKKGKFNAAKFAKDNDISMKVLKEQSDLLQGSIYDKRMLVSGKDMGRSTLTWIPEDATISDNALSKLHKSGLITYKRTKIDELFYDAFGREYIKGTRQKNPAYNLKKYLAIKDNLNEYRQLKNAINAKYPSINFQLDHPLSKSTLNKIFNASADELTRVNILDASLNNNFKKSLSSKYEKAISSKNFRAKKAVESIAKDLNLNIGKVSKNLTGYEYGVKEFQKLNIKDEIIKSLKNQKDLNYNFKNYIKKNPELFKIAGFEDPSKIGTKLTKVTDKHIQGVEKILKQAGFNIDKCLSSGGRVKLFGGGGVNTCIRGVIEAKQKKAMKTKNFGKFTKFGKLARTGAWILGPIDIPIELAFALPHMLAGDKEAAKRATTLGLFGYGKDKLDEIKAGSPESYKYLKHMKDNDDYIDAYFSAEDAKLNLDKLKDLPEHVQQEKKFIYNDQKLKAEEKMDSIMKGYEGYFDEDRIGQKKFDVWGEAKGKSATQDYLIKDVTEKTDKGLDMKEYGGHGMNIALGLPWNFGMKEGIAPFKGGKPITNLKQYIAQKGQPYWKQLEHAAYEAGRPELFDNYFATADVREPEDAYSDLPIKYASQLGKLEKEEMLRGLKAKGLHGTVGFKKMLEAQGIDPQEVWDVGKKDWEFDILGKRRLRASGGRAGYMGGGIAGIRRPHAIPPERQGLRSIMINGKKS